MRELAPRARILVAHGQMHERALEKVMLAFLAGEADVLVTTSIIESGIDIPTANTLIVERADMLGLAQLYQIRGRIGRSDAHAYAYLLYPSEELLTTEAAARLTTLSDHTDLGAGFKIAMADLEIRGAGNLLGDEQSGHVAAVGFEMYAQMLEEAVNELRGEQAAVTAPVRVDLPGDRLRAARLHRLRGDQDRRPPAHRARRPTSTSSATSRPSSPTASGRRPSRSPTCSRCRRSGSRRRSSARRRSPGAATGCSSTGWSWTTRGPAACARPAGASPTSKRSRASPRTATAASLRRAAEPAVEPVVSRAVRARRRARGPAVTAGDGFTGPRLGRGYYRWYY